MGSISRKRGPVTPALYDVWLAQARRDVAAASSLHDNGFCEWAVYLAAQGVEKAYKAYHHATGFNPPSIGSEGHDLVKLGSPFHQAAGYIDNTLSKKLIKLSGMARDARYPVNGRAGERIETSNSKDLVETSKEIIGLVDGTIRRLVVAFQGPAKG